MLSSLLRHYPRGRLLLRCLLVCLAHFHQLDALVPADCSAIEGAGLASHNALASPNYPHGYPSNTDCHRVLTAPSSFDIVFFFLHFDLEDSYTAYSSSSNNGGRLLPLLSVGSNSSSEQDCAADFVELRDGRYGFSRLLGRFCGHQVPGNDEAQLRATSGHMWIRFFSDATLEYVGFLGEYQLLKNHDKRLRQEECRFLEQSVLDGRIQSKDMLHFYEERRSNVAHHHHQECVWRVETPSAGMQMALFVDRTVFPEPGNCSRQSVEFYSGDTASEPTKRICDSWFTETWTGSSVLIVRIQTESMEVLRKLDIRLYFFAYSNANWGCSSAPTVPLVSCGDGRCVPVSVLCGKRMHCPTSVDSAHCRPTDMLSSLRSSSVWVLLLILLIVALGVFTVVMCRLRRFSAFLRTMAMTERTAVDASSTGEQQTGDRPSSSACNGAPDQRGDGHAQRALAICYAPNKTRTTAPGLSRPIAQGSLGALLASTVCGTARMNGAFLSGAERQLHEEEMRMLVFSTMNMLNKESSSTKHMDKTKF